MDKKKQRFQLQLAADLGYDITSPAAVENLIACIRYCDLRFSDRKLTEGAIAEKLGISEGNLPTIKRVAIKVATQIVLAEFMDSDTRNDVRAQLFQIYQDSLPDVLANMTNIAKGAVMGNKKDENGKEVPIHAPFRDQVNAAQLLLNNPIGNAWLTNTFLGEVGSLEESQHLALRQQLLEHAEVLDLDNVVDGVVTIKS